MDFMSSRHPNCLQIPMGGFDVMQCLGVGLDFKVESLPHTFTWPKVRWRGVMRMAGSPNRRVRLELLKVRMATFGTWIPSQTWSKHAVQIWLL